MPSSKSIWLIRCHPNRRRDPDPCDPSHNQGVPDAGSVRRRQAGVLVVGATEPEVQPWLRAARHATRAAPTAREALELLADSPADLVIADRERGGLDLPSVCR